MTTTQQDTKSGIDALFGGNVPPDRTAPMLEREHLERPIVVRHKGTRAVKTNNGMSTIHTFSLVAAEDKWFSLWGSANLNSQIRKLKPGAVLQLGYTGQVTNDDGTPGAHQWLVRPSTATLQSIVAYLGRPDEVKRTAELVEAIDRAQAADRERRAARAGGPDGPPHDDDDMPF